MSSNPNKTGAPGAPVAEAGMSTGAKVAIGLGIAAAAAAGIAALGAGGGYLIYNAHESSKQKSSPLQLHIKVISGHNLKAADHGSKFLLLYASLHNFLKLCFFLCFFYRNF